MDASVAPQRPGTTATEIAWQAFHRVIAAYCLLFGLFYWIRLVGYYPGSAWRFDLMAVHWQVAAVTLAVLFPFAAIGLWMLASWGPVVWFICAASETVMYVGFPELYGHRPAVVVAHGAVALNLCGAARRHLSAKPAQARGRIAATLYPVLSVFPVGIPVSTC